MSGNNGNGNNLLHFEPKLPSALREDVLPPNEKGDSCCISILVALILFWGLAYVLFSAWCLEGNR